MTYVTGYIASLIIFFGVDMIWLGIMAARVYRPIMGDIALSGVNLAPAIAFYTLYPIGLMLFAVVPGLKVGSLQTAALLGALFGFFTYATYDLTNQATLRNWTLQLSLVDIAWGTVLAAVAATIGFVVANRF